LSLLKKLFEIQINQLKCNPRCIKDNKINIISEILCNPTIECFDPNLKNKIILVIATIINEIASKTSIK